MLKIRISYTDEKELKAAVKLLTPLIRSFKLSKTDTGTYKKAYLTAGLDRRN